jgi:hypothetical protein
VYSAPALDVNYSRAEELAHPTERDCYLGACREYNVGAFPEQNQERPEKGCHHLQRVQADKGDQVQALSLSKHLRPQAAIGDKETLMSL